MANFTDKEIAKLMEMSNRQHIDLVKWLFDNHKKILREYEKTKGNLRIEFLDKPKKLTKREKKIMGIILEGVEEE